MHSFTPEDDRTARALAAFCLDRLAMLAPLDRPRTPKELAIAAGATVVPEGIGADEALRLWQDVLGPAAPSPHVRTGERRRHPAPDNQRNLYVS